MLFSPHEPRNVLERFVALIPKVCTRAVSRAVIDIGTMIVGIMSITTGTVITIGTKTGIATVATSTSMTTTRVKSEWASLNSLNFETIAFGTVT
jgi:hypothetical protein